MQRTGPLKIDVLNISRDGSDTSFQNCSYAFFSQVLPTIRDGTIRAYYLVSYLQLLPSQILTREQVARQLTLNMVVTHKTGSGGFVGLILHLSMLMLIHLGSHLRGFWLLTLSSSLSHFKNKPPFVIFWGGESWWKEASS